MHNIKILDLASKCTGCFACFNICSQDALKMTENAEGFLYPEIDVEKCTSCGLCDKVCPELKTDKAEVTPQVKKAFYGWHNDPDIRKKSSSGGFFSLLSENILKDSGVVFGAVHDLISKVVIHKSTLESGLPEMRKSKYVQSYIGNAFRSVKELLIQDKRVLFAGTPCQVAGLLSYLGKNYDNLITCDFICHGVPPMKLLNNHLSELEKKHNSVISEVDFRPKSEGWSYYELKCTFENGTIYHSPSCYDTYFTAFFTNLSLRSSCFQCSYSHKQHDSDITLADFWGYRNYKPAINDEKGISLALVNSTKGERLIKNLENYTINELEWKYAEYVFQKRTPENYRLKERDSFYALYLKKGYRKANRKLNLSGSFKSKILRNIKKYLGK
jgi:NAD-dependent dihydropyrimidine dehydrogenase PreA subunit